MNSNTKGLIFSGVFGGLFILLLGFRTYIYFRGYDSVEGYFKGDKKLEGGNRHKKLIFQKRRRHR